MLQLNLVWQAFVKVYFHTYSCISVDYFLQSLGVHFDVASDSISDSCEYLWTPEV